MSIFSGAEKRTKRDIHLTRALDFVDLCHDSGSPKQAWPSSHCSIGSLYGRGVIDSGQRPPYIKILVSLAEPLPFGRAMSF